MVKTKRIKNCILSLILVFSLFAGMVFIISPIETSAASKPTQVTGVKSAPYKDQGVTLSWKKVKGASGYEVYKNGYLLKRVSKASYVDKIQNRDKTYQYKIRAYKKVKVTKYYNKKTKKWQTKKPAKKYRGKSKKVTTRSYGSFSKTLKVKAHDERPRLYGTAYSCVKYGDDLYCTDSVNIYKVDLTDNSVSTFISGDSYVDFLSLEGSDLYYSKHGNGLGATIYCTNLDNGNTRIITSDADSYKYTIIESRLYYGKYDNSTEDYVTYSVDLSGGDKIRESYVLNVTQDGSADPDYEYMWGKLEEYCWNTYISTNTGDTINVSRGYYDSAVVDAPAYDNGKFTATASEISKRMEFYYWLFNLYHSDDDYDTYDMYAQTERINTDDPGVFEAIDIYDNDSVRLEMYKNGSLCGSSDIPDRIEMGYKKTTGVMPITQATGFALRMTLDPSIGADNALAYWDMYGVYLGEEMRWGDAEITFECDYLSYMGSAIALYGRVIVAEE